MRAAGLPRLMLVTDRRVARRGDLLRAVRDAFQGGVRLVQVREKDLPDEPFRALLLRLLEAAPEGARLVVNGRPAIARSAGVGLHMPAALPAPNREGIALYGRSAHDEADCRAALAERVDYLVIGPVFPTPSKPGHPGSGVELARRAAEIARPVPVYAIGGVTVSRVPEIVHAGAHGVAVCRAILQAPSPRQAAEAFALALEVAARKAP